MKLNILIAVCIGVFAYALTLYLDQVSTATSPPKQPHIAKLQTGEKVPEFSFETIKGKKFTITDFKDKVVILNFWASWCAPCVKEFPIFLEVAKKHRGKVVFIGLSSDHDKEAMMRFLKKINTEASNVLIAQDQDTEITRNLFQTYRLPETIIIDRQQNLSNKLVGAGWDSADLEKMIADL